MADPGFPKRRGHNPQGWGPNLLCGQIFLENSVKLKEIIPGGRVPGIPLRSANGYVAIATQQRLTTTTITVPQLRVPVRIIMKVNSHCEYSFTKNNCAMFYVHVDRCSGDITFLELQKTSQTWVKHVGHANNNDSVQETVLPERSASRKNLHQS